jgi:hypothetical protein
MHGYRLHRDGCYDDRGYLICNDMHDECLCCGAKPGEPHDKDCQSYLAIEPQE